MKHPISFKKLNQDTSPNLTQQGDYFEAVNGRIMLNDDQTAFAFSNEKGTELIEHLPVVRNDQGNFEFDVIDHLGATMYSVSYTSAEAFIMPPTTTEAHKIIATCELKERWFVISQEASYYLIWEWDDNNTRLQLLYYNDFGARLYENLRIITRYENENTQKIYFLDSNTLWHFNVKDGTDTIDTLLNQVKAFPDTSDGTINHLENPKLVSMLPGGSFPAGKVQYAYNLYSDSGAETKISAFSNMLNVSDVYYGLNETEVNSNAFKIEIENIPEGFNTINIYRIFYSSDVATPEVSLIIEDNLQDTSYTFIDDNNLQESDSSLETILFLGSDPFTATDMAVKDNVLFPVNIEYQEYDPEFDARAFAFNSAGTPVALVEDASLGNVNVNTAFSNIPAATHDCINPSVSADVGDLDYNVYRYQSDGSTLGVEGLNVKIGFVTDTRTPYNSDISSITPNQNSMASNPEVSNAFGNMSFKRDEVYRFFIRFTNSKGQKSFAKWIADVRIPSYDTYPISSTNAGGDLTVDYLGVAVTLKNAPSNAVSWEVLREVRNESDKTIKAQGFVNNTLLVTEGTNRSRVGSVVPNPFVRCYHDDSRVTATAGGTFLDGLGHSYENGRTSKASGPTDGDITNFGPAEILDTNSGGSYQLIDYVVEFYSPEILQKRYQFDVASSDYVNFIGGLTLSDKPRFLGNTDANTVAGTSPATPFNELTVGQNANELADRRAFIRWDAAEGETFAPGAVSSKAPDAFYINSYIAAFFAHDVNNIEKVNIVGDAKFIPNSAVRGETVISYDSGGNNQTSVMQNCELTLKDNATTPEVYYYGSRVNDRVAFNLDNYSSGTAGLGSILQSGGDVDHIMTRTATPKLVLVDYKAVVPNQYGGNTYEARQLNNPVVISGSIPIATAKYDIYGGDTYVCLWNFMRQQCFQGYYRRRTQRENILMPVETSINLDLRHDEEFFTNLGRYQTTFENYELPEKVYSRDFSYPISFVKPINYQANNKFDNRVLASDVKVNGEIKDSWLKFRENNYIDLDGIHGGITGIIEDRDQLFTFQPEAVSQLLINPRVQSVDPVGIQLGKGDLLYDYNYMTTTSGSINKYSLIKTPYGIMYYDGINNKISIINRGENPISDIKGMNTFFRNELNKPFVVADTPNGLKGVQTYYDHETKETYFSFQQGPGSLSKTLVFNHLLDSFHFTHDFAMYHPINVRGRVFWVNENFEEIHEHKVGDRGFYFGEYKDSYITFITNPSFRNSVYDTIQFNFLTSTEGTDVFNSSINTIQVYNEHQDTGEVTLEYGSDLKRKFREWRVNIPRESGTRNRIMSPYTYITLKWNNDNNYKKVLKDVVVNYRPKTVDYS